MNQGLHGSPRASLNFLGDKVWYFPDEFISFKIELSVTSVRGHHRTLSSFVSDVTVLMSTPRREENIQ